MKSNIAIIYHSESGTTEKLARSVADGIDANDGTIATVCRIQGRDIVEGRFENKEILEVVSRSVAVIFGSPTYMGCVSAQFKAFADASSDLWTERKWAGKLSAGFTIGSNMSGDQLNTIQYLQILASQHGMLWVSLDMPGGYDPLGRNRLGAQSGLIAHTTDSNIDSKDRETAKYLGERVARLAIVLGNG